MNGYKAMAGAAKEPHKVNEHPNRAERRKQAKELRSQGAKPMRRRIVR